MAITDTDNANVASATVTLTTVQTGDTLALNGLSGTSGTLASGIGWNIDTTNPAQIVVTFTNSASKTDYQNALQLIEFNTSGTDTTNRIINVVVNDGTLDSNTATSTVYFHTLDLDAAATPGTGYTTTFTEGGGAVAIANPGLAEVVITDPDSANIASATVTIANFQPGEDTLSFTHTAHITGGYDPVHGVLTLTGDMTTSATDFAAALHAVTYSDTSHAPNTTDRDISVVVTDSNGVSTNAANTIVHITAVNDAPVLTGVGPTHATSTERVAATLDGGAAVSDAELDALNSGNGDYSGASLTIARNGGANADDAFAVVAGSGFTVSGNALQAGGLTFATFTSAGGTLTIDFTSSATPATTALVNDVLDHVTYANQNSVPPANVTLDYSFNDGNTVGAQGTGGARTSLSSLTVDITAANDAPVLTGVGPTHATSTERVAATLDGGAAVSDAELDALNSGNGDYSGASLTIARNGGANAAMRSRSLLAAASP